MATLQGLNEAVARIQETTDMVIAQYNAMKNSAITPADLDAPVAAINEVANKLIAAVQP